MNILLDFGETDSIICVRKEFKMTDVERRQLLNKIKKTAREITHNPSTAKKVLRQTGVYTPNGNLKKAFS